MGSYQPISRVAIIGAGPTGVTFAKYLLAEKCFETIDLFEQRDRIGGIWNLSSTDRTRRIPIPQTDPRYGSHHSASTVQDGKHNGKAAETSNNDNLEFESPLYDYLETNIPKYIMRYSDLPFPEHFPLYPSHQEVLEYLETYAHEVKHLIRFEVQVQDVKLMNHDCSSSRDSWQVKSRDLTTGETKEAVYDAVVVASGHYTVPYVPAIKGVAEWNNAYPGAIIHSKAYRKPEDFAGQTVLVVGNSASGLEIAGQIGQCSSKTYLSGRSESAFGVKNVNGRNEVGEIIEFLSPDQHRRAVKTKSGTIIEDLDSVVFATGYFYNFPFLSSLDPPIITDGLRTRDVYQHFIHIEHPELAFPLLNMRIIPFGLAENQAAVVARLWSGRLQFPPKEHMRAWEKEMIGKKGDGKHFHLQKFPEDGTQINELYRWALSATPAPGLADDGQGKLGTVWDEYMVWLRSQSAPLRMAFTKRGKDRRNVRTLEELGFIYADWRKHASDEDLEMFRQAQCSSGAK